jgi:hypothetical protein
MGVIKFNSSEFKIINQHNNYQIKFCNKEVLLSKPLAIFQICPFANAQRIGFALNNGNAELKH